MTITRNHAMVPDIENGSHYQTMQKIANEQLTGYLAGRGLRSTGQRDAILKLFMESGRHVSAEELYALVKKAHPRIGPATVYRTLKLFSEAGLADARHFDDGFTRFEYKTSDSHHDHLICTQCGAIIEFKNQRIETLQEDVAREHNFTVQNHRLEIYGMCSSCSKKKSHRKKRKKPLQR